jgi:hypothetical protein
MYSPEATVEIVLLSHFILFVALAFSLNFFRTCE